RNPLLDLLQERSSRVELGMLREKRRRNFTGFKEQIFAFFVGRLVRRAPQVALGAGAVAVRQTHDGQAARLAPVSLRVPALPLLVLHQRLAVTSREKQRVAKVVVAEDEVRSDRDRAPQRRFRFLEPSRLAAED